MSTVLILLPWVAPPIIGAIIGYGTNRLALRMLFRPHRAKYLLGFRVPFTPGIIPKSRAELADNVGRAVAEELLTPEAIWDQLKSPALRANLRQWVGQQRRSLMETPITLSSDQQGKLLAIFAEPITHAVRRILEQPTVREQLTELVSEAINDYVERQNIVVRTAFRTFRPLAANIVNGVINDAIDALSRNINPHQISSLMHTLERGHHARKISDFLELTPDREAQIDDYITDRLLVYLGEQLPALVDILDVERLVTERVNALEVESVEKLILDVTARQLKWINWFGAILGFAIGLLQLPLRLLQ